MSAIDTYWVALQALGLALVEAATGVADTGVVAPGAKEEMQAAYVTARANIAIAEALAKFALSQTADKAAQIAAAAGHLVTDSAAQLNDVATHVGHGIELTVKEAYQKAIDLGVEAAKGVGSVVDEKAKQVFWTIEAQVLVALAAAGAYVWWTTRTPGRGPSRALMIRELEKSGT